MTAEQKQFIKYNIGSWINLTTLFAVISFVIYQSRWQEHVDNHIDDKSKHMTFEKRIQVFVPRIELDKRLSNIENSQEKLEQKQDQIIEILMFETKK